MPTRQKLLSTRNRCWLDVVRSDFAVKFWGGIRRNVGLPPGLKIWEGTWASVPQATSACGRAMMSTKRLRYVLNFKPIFVHRVLYVYAVSRILQLSRVQETTCNWCSCKLARAAVRPWVKTWLTLYIVLVDLPSELRQVHPENVWLLPKEKCTLSPSTGLC